jgi:hypothetical protein
MRVREDCGEKVQRRVWLERGKKEIRPCSGQIGAERAQAGLPPTWVLYQDVRLPDSDSLFFWMRFTHSRPARSLCATKVDERKDYSWEAFESTVLQATLYLSRRP